MIYGMVYLANDPHIYDEHVFYGSLHAGHTVHDTPNIYNMSYDIFPHTAQHRGNVLCSFIEFSFSIELRSPQRVTNVLHVCHHVGLPWFIHEIKCINGLWLV